MCLECENHSNICWASFHCLIRARKYTDSKNGCHSSYLEISTKVITAAYHRQPSKSQAAQQMHNPGQKYRSYLIHTLIRLFETTKTTKISFRKVGTKGRGYIFQREYF